MRILSADRQSFIEISFLEAEMSHLPSIRTMVSAENDGFNGTLSSVWFEIEDLDYFLSYAHQMDLQRSGKARLSSMSPCDFILDFEVYDKTGHIKTLFTMAKTVSYPFFRELSLKGCFEIDTSEFTSIIKEFEKLKQQA